MNLGKLRAVGYGWLALQGLLGLAVPRRYVKLVFKPYLLAFENTDELELKPWCVRTTRIASIGMLVSGIVGILVETAGPELESDPDLDEITESSKLPDAPSLPGSSKIPSFVPLLGGDGEGSDGDGGEVGGEDSDDDATDTGLAAGE
jgi:hypothetical protein